MTSARAEKEVADGVFEAKRGKVGFGGQDAKAGEVYIGAKPLLAQCHSAVKTDRF